jgi:4-aminobutyrate aminotransferase-like enzyme
MHNCLKNIPKSISKLHSDILPISAKGSFIHTKNKKFLDLTTGIGALSTGHNHPKIINKVKEQLEKYVHFPQQVFQTHPAQLECNEKIISTFKNKNLDNIFYVNSGSEAIDNAIKISRVHTKKSNIISMNKGFHGRTISALSITSSNTVCKQGISPLIPNIYFCENMTKDSLDKVLNYQSSPNDTAAIIIEPVQGEGGIFSAEMDFLKYVQKICNENNILFVADEVQCGAMRTGTWWNFEEKGVVPDLVTFAKGIASGYPIGGVIGSSDIMSACPPGSLGGTYGGNAICSVAASATIDIINSEDFTTNVKMFGNYIYEKLSNLEYISNIRQYGLMIGIELHENIESRQILQFLKDDGILVLLAGNKGQYIRVLPPLNIKKEEVDMFVNSMKSIENKL